MTNWHQHHNRGFSQTELLVAIVVIGLVVALTLPGFAISKDKAMEAEVKSNLHSIQVSLERYATDHSGTYPAFILGGTLNSWGCVGVLGCPGGQPIPDALIGMGYIGTYPANPFLRHGSSLCEWTAGDPRFGCLGKASRQAEPLVMGNALSDPNFATPDTAANPGTLGPEGFPYYFLGDGDPTTNDWLPGTFIYRTLGEPQLSEERREQNCGQDPTRPYCADGYYTEPRLYYHFLSAYGSWRTPGKDYLHCYDPHDPAGGFGSVPGGVRCEPEGFDPWVLLAHEPKYDTPDVDGDGDPDYIPNVTQAEASASLVIAGGVYPSNPDGFADGLLVFFNAGSDQPVGL